MNKEIIKKLNIIKDHCRTEWAYDIEVAIEMYPKYERLYAVLTPFMYVLLEDCVRELTSEGYALIKENDRRQIGWHLLKLAVKENGENEKLKSFLLCIQEKYYQKAHLTAYGSSRNTVAHAFSRPYNWSEDSFFNLVTDISELLLLSEQKNSPTSN